MKFQGKPIINGYGRGKVMMTDHAVNFTAAFTKAENIIPGKKAEVRDRHHPWFRKNIKNRVIIIPACIGSTHTGLVLLDLVSLKNGPAAIIVDEADTLLVSGIILSEVWFDRAIPVVEYPTKELMDKLKEGDDAEVNGETGEIIIHGGKNGAS